MSNIERALKIEQQYQTVTGALMNARQSLHSTEADLEVTISEHDALIMDFEMTKKSVEVMKQLITEMSKKGMDTLQNLLTFGLQTIFDDRSYTFEIEISDRGDVKTAEFYLVEDKSGNKVRSRLRNSVGGGIQTIVSMVLRIYFILTMDLRKVLFLDEAMTQLSGAYVEGLFRFLSQVRDDLGFEILWVTHDTRFTSYADHIFEVRMGSITKTK